MLDSGGVLTALQAKRPQLLARACAESGRRLSEADAARALDVAGSLYDAERELLFNDTPAFHLRYQGLIFSDAGLGPPDDAILERYATLLQAKQYRTTYPDVVPTLEELRRSGLSLGLLSNAHSDLRKLLTYFDLWAYFDAHLISWDEGMEKPDARFFHLGVGRLGLHPAEVVYIGDDPLLDYEGAQRAGLPALLLDRGGLYRGKAGLRSIPDLFSLPDALRGLEG